MRKSKLLLYSSLFSLFAVYTVIWAILEPFPIDEKYSLTRWLIILGVSILIVLISSWKRGLLSYVYFRYIRPLFINKLQVLDTSHANESLHQGWKSVHGGHQVYPEVIEDSLFGKACRFTDATTHDAIHGLKLIAKERATKIDYFIKPLSEDSGQSPVMYIRVEVRNITKKTSGKNDLKWLTLVIDKVHNAETFEYSEMEEIVHVKSTATFMDWMYFTIDIPEIVKKIKRWENTFAFNRIDSFKTRGSFDLASVIFYK